MFKKLFLALGLSFLATTASAVDLKEVNRILEENNFQVDNSCTGTLISVEHRLITTAYHCISQAITRIEEPDSDIDGFPKNDESLSLDNGVDHPRDKIKRKTKVKTVPVYQFAWDAEGDRHTVAYESKIVARNIHMDLAVLEIPKEVAGIPINIRATKDVPLSPKGSKVLIGEEVWSIGNPAMMYGVVTKGIVSSYRDLREYMSTGLDVPQYYIQYDGSITGGNSGGAMLNDKGEYVGTTVMKHSRFDWIAWSVPTDVMWKLLEDNCLADKVGGENPTKCGIAKKPSMGVDSQ